MQKMPRLRDQNSDLNFNFPLEEHAPGLHRIVTSLMIKLTPSPQQNPSGATDGVMVKFRTVDTYRSKYI
jgi:hypothetical protein